MLTCLMTKKYIFLSLLIPMLGILSCGGYDPEGTGGTGSLAFKIDWQGAPTASKVSLQGEDEAISKNSTDQGFSPAYAPLDCTTSGVSTVSATVYSSTGSSLATGGPWSCSVHAGNIANVPAGTNMKLTVLGKDSSGNILYSGEQTGITVVDGQTSPTVTITVTPVSPDTTAPSSPSVSINSGAASTTSTSVTLTLSATDNVGVTGYYASETSTTPSASASGWTAVTSTTSYSATVSFTLSSSSGTKTVYVWFKDAAGNISTSASDSITLTVTSGATVTDIDGNVYNTVTIGTQTWMKENLKVTKYRNGDAIGTTTASISNDSSSKYQWAYNNDESNAATYGRLYTWYAATDSRGVCPTGWHVPTDAEWTTLIDYLGGYSVAGGRMKEAGSSGWTALLGGFRHYLGTSNFMGYQGFWWSATEIEPNNASIRKLDSGTSVWSSDDSKETGFSVRCVRD